MSSLLQCSMMVQRNVIAVPSRTRNNLSCPGEEGGDEAICYAKFM
jgi:hypothetical protein